MGKNTIQTEEVNRHKRWNNILRNLTEKYAGKEFEAPELFGDFRDKEAKPPNVEETDEGFSVSQICEPKVLAEVYNHWKTRHSSFRERCYQKRRKKLKSTENINNKSSTNESSEASQGASCEEEKELPEVIYICDVKVPKSPKYFVHPVSKKKLLVKFIDI